MLDWDDYCWEPTEEEMMEEMFRDMQLDTIYGFVDTLRKFNKEGTQTGLGSCELFGSHRRIIDSEIDFTMLPVNDRQFVVLEYIYLCASLRDSSFKPPIFPENSSFWTIFETFLKLEHKHGEINCINKLEHVLVANPHMEEYFKTLRYQLGD